MRNYNQWMILCSGVIVIPYLIIYIFVHHEIPKIIEVFRLISAGGLCVSGSFMLIMVTESVYIQKLRVIFPDFDIITLTLFAAVASIWLALQTCLDVYGSAFN